MSSYDIVNITADAFSIALSLLLLGALLLTVHHHSRKRKWLIACIVTNMLSLAVDIATYFINENTGLPKLWSLLTSLSYVVPVLVFYGFLQFLQLHLNEKTSISRTYFIVAKVYTVALALLTAVFCHMGLIYSLEGGYHLGPLNPFYVAGAMVLPLFSLLVVILYSRQMEKRDIFAVISFFIMPILGGFITFLNDNLGIGAALLSFSFLTVYITIGDEEQRYHRRKERQLNAIARQDELTGVMNRHAYTERVDNMPVWENVGVVFCDLNGLKRVNDEQGHAAGDRLFLDFSDILLSIYDVEDVFRVSGDEFVIMPVNMPEKEFNSRASKLWRRVMRNEIPMASIGIAYGVGREIIQLIRKAEKRMYMDKNRHYAQHPELKRER